MTRAHPAVCTWGARLGGHRNVLSFPLSSAVDLKLPRGRPIWKNKNIDSGEAKEGPGKRGSPAGSQRVCCGMHGACFLLHHPHDTPGTPAFPTRVFTSMGSWWGNRDPGVGRAGISEPEWGQGGTVRVPGTCKNLDGPHVQPGWRAALKALRPSLVSAAPSAVSRTWRALPLWGHALPDGSPWLQYPPPCPILNRGTALSAGARSSKD